MMIGRTEELAIMSQLLASKDCPCIHRSIRFSDTLHGFSIISLETPSLPLLILKEPKVNLFGKTAWS